MKTDPQQNLKDLLREMELQQIWIEKASVESHVLPAKEPEDKKADIAVSANFRHLDDSELLVNTEFTVTTTDSNDKEFAKIEVTFSSRYKTKIKMTDDAFESFVLNIQMPQVVPYVREFVQNMTARMSLSRMTLPLWKSAQLKPSPDKQEKSEPPKRKTELRKKKPQKSTRMRRKTKSD
jgi:preprotein translocase subunit SecB